MTLPPKELDKEMGLTQLSVLDKCPFLFSHFHSVSSSTQSLPTHPLPLPLWVSSLWMTVIWLMQLKHPILHFQSKLDSHHLMNLSAKPKLLSIFGRICHPPQEVPFEPATTCGTWLTVSLMNIAGPTTTTHLLIFKSWLMMLLDPVSCSPTVN